MRVALAQLNFTIGAFDQTYQQIGAAVERARALGADLAVFTELATTGYPPRDLLTHESFIRASLDLLDRVAALSDERFGIVVGCVTPNTAGTGKPLFNTAALCRGGAVVGRHHKTLLPTYDVFDEDRYFEPGLHAEPFEFLGRRLGLTVCEEVWNDRDFWPRRLYQRDPVCELAGRGADLLVNISSSPFTIGKAQLRREMIRQEAVKNARPFLYVNQVGGNDELVFDGHSLVFDARGEVVLRGADFAEDFLVCDVPSSGAPVAVTSPRGFRLQAEVSGGADLPAEAGSHADGEPRDRELSAEEQAFEALTLGVRDYVRKCGFSRVVLGLSGGIDSAVTAALAAAALGPGQGHRRGDAHAVLLVPQPGRRGGAGAQPRYPVPRSSRSTPCSRATSTHSTRSSRAFRRM